MIDFKQLKYALVLSTTGNYARAASELHISQPALSRSIMKLEEKLGAQLFVRSKNQTIPTPEGKRILSQAHKVMFEVQKLEQKVDEEKGILAGKLVVGFGPYPEEFMAANILAAVSERLPDLKILSLTVNSVEFIAGLYGKNIDFFIGEKSLVEKDRSLTSKALLADDRGYFFCRTGHPLLALSDLQFDDIFSYPFVCSHITTGRITSKLPVREPFGEFEGSVLTPRICCHSFTIQKRVVAACDGIGLGTKLSIEEEIKRGGLVILPIETGLAVNFGICYLKDRKLSKLDKAFIDIVSEVDRNRHEAAHEDS